MLLVLAGWPAFCAPSIPAPPTVPTLGGSVIRVSVNGSPVRFDVDPIVSGGSVYVPLRGVFEQLGATVAFDRASGAVTAQRAATTVELKVGSTLARVNGENMVMLQPALYKNGRTLVPLRFLSEALGAGVEWNPVRREVDITADPAPKKKR